MRNTLEWYNNHQNELNWVCNRFFQHWYAHNQYQFFWISTMKREWDLAEKEINHCKIYYHTLYIYTFPHFRSFTTFSWSPPPLLLLLKCYDCPSAGISVQASSWANSFLRHSVTEWLWSCCPCCYCAHVLCNDR